MAWDRMAESESTPDPARAVAEGRGSDKSGHMHMPMGRNLPRPDGVFTKRRSVEDDHVDTSLYRRAHLHDGQRCRVRYRRGHGAIDTRAQRVRGLPVAY